MTPEIQEFQIKSVKSVLDSAIEESGVKINKADSTESEFHNTLKIIIPKSQNKLQAAFNLVKQYQEEETLRNTSRSYPYYFMNDFLLSVYKIIMEEVGILHISQRDTDGSGAVNEYIQLPIGLDKKGKQVTEQGYYGSLRIPAWDNAIMDVYPNGNITIRGKLKFNKEIGAFLDRVEEKLKSFSVVHGKAVELEIMRGGIIANFIKVKKHDKIVLSQQNERIIGNLILPSMRDESKSSILFTGDFGTLN